jgi:hypothetical protein
MKTYCRLLTTAGIMILTLGKVNLSCAMEGQAISLEQRVARLENSLAESEAEIATLKQIVTRFQASERVARFHASKIFSSEPESTIERAMGAFSYHLQRYLGEKVWSDEIGAKIKQFQQIALQTEKKLSEGTITSNDASNTITQNMKQIDQALSAAIRRTRPD